MLKEVNNAVCEKKNNINQNEKIQQWSKRTPEGMRNIRVQNKTANAVKGK